MEPVDALIFSKNRPAQLECLLYSISRYAPWLYRTVTVLYTVSAPEYDAGYSQLGGYQVEWLPQRRFQTDVTRWLRNGGKYVSFLCDDDVFYRPAPAAMTVPWSLRGGDYDYPFSVDGNIYLRDDILGLLAGLSFTNPTRLEHIGFLHRDRLPFRQVNYGVPCLVGVPLNRVSDDSLMPHFAVHEFDLNERFLDGFRLRYDLDEQGTYGAHAAQIPELLGV